MKHLYLVRHGESIQNVGINEKLRIPDHAIPLTKEGERQAAAVAMFLSEVALSKVPKDNVVMWVSPYQRTRQTAQIILDRLLISDVKEDDMLTELQFGIFDSIPLDKLPSLFPDEVARYQNNLRFNGRFYARFPGGESPFDCEIRQKLFLDTLFRDINGGCPDHIIIVGHGAALKLLRKAIFHYSHEWYANEANSDNCSVQSIILNAGKNTDAGYIYGHPAERRIK